MSGAGGFFLSAVLTLSFGASTDANAAPRGSAPGYLFSNAANETAMLMACEMHGKFVKQDESWTAEQRQELAKKAEKAKVSLVHAIYNLAGLLAEPERAIKSYQSSLDFYWGRERQMVDEKYVDEYRTKYCPTAIESSRRSVELMRSYAKQASQQR